MIFNRTNNLARVLLRAATMTVFVAGAVLVTPAHAALVFSENFDSLNLTTPVPPNNFSDHSETGTGNYIGQLVASNFAAGWTVSANDVYDFQTAGNGSILLNETTGTISRTITGLTIGLPTVLTLSYWGDNQAGAYILNIGINSSTTVINGTSTGTVVGAGAIKTATVNFTPTSTSSTLSLSQGGSTAGGPAPIIDNLAINSLPEPATFILFVPVLAFIAFRMRKLNRA